MAPKVPATKKQKFTPYVPVISHFCGSSKHIGDLPDYESSPSRSGAPSPPGEFTLFSLCCRHGWACRSAFSCCCALCRSCRSSRGSFSMLSLLISVFDGVCFVPSILVLSTPFSGNTSELRGLIKQRCESLILTYSPGEHSLSFVY